MRKAILAIIFCISGFILFAQDAPPSVQKIQLNNINLNFLGNASLISVNYERLFLISDRFFLAGQVGGGYNEQGPLLRCMLGCESPPEKYMTLPLHITGNMGVGKNNLELGLGGTGIYGTETSNYYLYPIIGFRKQPLYAGRLNLRAFISVPFNMRNTNTIIFIPFGFSTGFCF